MINPKILLVDFDKTLGHTSKYPACDPPTWMNKLVAWYVKREQRKGWYIILNTCREGGTLISALGYLKLFYGFIPDNENFNAPWNIAEYGDCRKISGVRSIDDTQVGFIGWLLRRFG